MHANQHFISSISKSIIIKHAYKFSQFNDDKDSHINIPKISEDLRIYYKKTRTHFKY